MNEKCTTNQENCIAERHKEEWLLQQRMSAMLTTLFSAARKELHILFKQCDYSI